jgi:translation elongation factor P/translation initiation factor 5A
MPFLLDNLNRNYSFTELYHAIVFDGEKIKEIFKDDPDILKTITVEFKTMEHEYMYGDDDEYSQMVADDCLEMLKEITLKK